MTDRTVRLVLWAARIWLVGAALALLIRRAL